MVGNPSASRGAHLAAVPGPPPHSGGAAARAATTRAVTAQTSTGRAPMPRTSTAQTSTAQTSRAQPDRDDAVPSGRRGRFARKRRGTVPGRVAVLLSCAAALAWVWWGSQADGRVLHPASVLGRQLVGELLLAAVAIPVLVEYRFGRRGRAHPLGDLLTRLARARHRIQLLDTTGCLLFWSDQVRGAPLAELEGDRDRLVEALRTALDRDVAVEILVPEPGLAQSRGVLRALGLTAAGYRRLADAAEAELLALHDEVPAGRLDIRTAQRWPALAMVRCDGRVWISPRSDAVPDSGPLWLEFGARSPNARAVAAYFNELHRPTGLFG
jgi:hypothetical protein